jgi:hypothetical protein
MKTIWQIEVEDLDDNFVYDYIVKFHINDLHDTFIGVFVKTNWANLLIERLIFRSGWTEIEIKRLSEYCVSKTIDCFNDFNQLQSILFEGAEMESNPDMQMLPEEPEVPDEFC